VQDWHRRWGGREYDVVLGIGCNGNKLLEKMLASPSANLNVLSGREREVSLGGGTKVIAEEYFVLWSIMTCSKCTISSSEEGWGSVGVHEQCMVEETQGEQTNCIGRDLL